MCRGPRDMGEGRAQWEELVLFVYIVSMPYSFFIALKLPAERGIRLMAMAPVLTSILLSPSLFKSTPMGRVCLVNSFVSAIKILFFCFDGPYVVDARAYRWARSDFFRFSAFIVCPIGIGRTDTGAPRNRLRRIAHDAMVVAFWITSITLASYFECHRSRALLRAALCLFTYAYLVILHRCSSILFLLAFGVELAPAFDRPWLASSLNDFWAKRWNLAVHSALRKSVYEPSLYFLSPPDTKPINFSSTRQATKPLLRARIPAVFLTFLLSGLLHETMYCCVTLSNRFSWEVTAFFVIHGVVTCMEIIIRRVYPEHRRPFTGAPHILKVLCTMALVLFTAYNLFHESLISAGIFTQWVDEYAALLRRIGRAVLCLV